MKVAFSTWCTDDYFEKAGLNKLLSSTTHFHPDVDHYVYDDEATKKVKEKWPWMWGRWMMASTCLDLSKTYDVVLHLDGDCIITAPLDEIIEGDYDVAGTRNNNDYGKAGMHPGITFGDIPMFGFLNAGLVASTKTEFWEDWNNINHEWDTAKSYGPTGGGENDSLNIIFHSGKYKGKILDPIGSDISYGVNNAWGGNTNWDSWSEMYVNNDRIYLDSPRGYPVMIKVLHVAGGTGIAPTMKQNHREHYNMKPEVLDYIDHITSHSPDHNSNKRPSKGYGL